ncbi:hypothetical protein D5086_027464, partial [Populus alba]
IYPRLRYSWNSHFFYQIWGDQCFLGSSKFDSYKVGDLKRRESIFTTGKPTSVQLRMNTASSTQHSISELTKAWKTWKGALQQCLEVIDPRHRVGRNLNFYFQMWMTSSGGQPFFYWLDVGDGKTVNHPECSREKLRQERNTYLELIATAVLDYLSSQQRQPRYALSGMILSITVMAISLIQLAHTVGKEGFYTTRAMSFILVKLSEKS